MIGKVVTSFFFHTWPLSHLFPRRAVRRAPVAKLTLNALYFDWIKQFSTTCPVNIWRSHLVPTKQRFKEIERKFGRVWTRSLGTTQHLCIPTVPHTGLWVCLVAKPTSLRIRNVLEPCEQMIKRNWGHLVRDNSSPNTYTQNKQFKLNRFDVFFSYMIPSPPIPSPTGGVWHSCKMAARNAKRSMSMILWKNKGLWTVYLNMETSVSLRR